MLLAAALGSAVAGEVSVIAEGTRYSGSVEIAAPVDVVRDLVRDPVRSARASGRPMNLHAVGSRGDCTQYAMTLPTMLGPLRGVLEACDTDEGSVVTMVEGDAFDRYVYRYRVEGVAEDRTRVTYELELSSNLPVPRAIVRHRTRREVAKALAQLARWTPDV